MMRAAPRTASASIIVEEIRARYESTAHLPMRHPDTWSQRKLAAEYGVGKSQVDGIVRASVGSTSDSITVGASPSPAPNVRGLFDFVPLTWWS
jgi:hypothetical protein